MRMLLLACCLSVPSGAAAEEMLLAFRGPLPAPALIVSRIAPGPAYQSTVARLVASRPRIDHYDAVIARYARQRRLDPRLVKAIIAAESEFLRTAVSPAGARGLMQVMPSTSRGVGVAPERLFEPEENIKAGTAYLELLFGLVWKRYKLAGPYAAAPPWVVQRVVAGYHAGPRYLGGDRWLRSTEQYVRKVTLHYHSSVTALDER